MPHDPLLHHFPKVRRFNPADAKPMASGGDWPEPDMSVLIERTGAPSLPLDLLPDDAAEVVRSTAAATCSPQDYAFVALLTAAAAAIGNARIAACDDWTEPAILWVAAVGDPSTSKSPALAPFVDA